MPYKHLFLKLVFVLACADCRSQNYENEQYVINVAKQQVTTYIFEDDTIRILKKLKGSDNIKETEINKLDKRIQFDFRLPDSLPDGKYGVFYNDSKKNLAFCVGYRGGKKQGSYTFYNYNGSLRETGFYQNGCYDKVRTEYSSDGIIISVSNFNSCCLNGVAIVFYNNGQFCSLTTYKDGKKNGKFIQYRYDKMKRAKLQYEYIYENGEIIR